MKWICTACAAALVLVIAASASAQSTPSGPVLELRALKQGAARHPKLGFGLSRALDAISARGITRQNARARNVAALSNAMIRIRPDGEVQVYVHYNVFGASERAALIRNELAIELVSPELKVVQGWVPFDRLVALADLPFVRRVTAPSYPRPRAGSVTTQGDAILRADQLRAQGLTGEGARVGILSPGAHGVSQAQSSGDLPAQISVYGSTCDTSFYGPLCGEGTAMAEIVHDIAPGAALAIAVPTTSAQFISLINTLINTFRADIIVDDIGIFDEPVFADGPVAQAVAAVTDKVLFVSAAGNEGQGHYEADFLATAAPGFFFGSAHNFGAAVGQGSDRSMDLTIPPGAGVVVFLQWNDPFGGSANDYDLWLLNSAESGLLCPPGLEAFCVGFDLQTGFQDPIEFVLYVNQTGGTQTGKILVEKFSGAAGRLELFVIADPGVTVQYNNPAGSIFGHPAVPGVLAVGAINAGDPGADTIAPYSSRGPSRIDFPSVQSRAKPDLAAIDNVSVSGAFGFPTTFPGTSAAAPHVAGIAALLKGKVRRARPEHLRQALTESAVDLGIGGRDDTYGFGRVDALAAWQTAALQKLLIITPAGWLPLLLE